MTRHILALAMALAAAGCVEDPTLGTDQSLVKNGNGDECPKLGCSSNSAYLGPTEFHELEETGTYANDEGFRITSFTKTVGSVTTTYRPDVSGTTLVGKRYSILIHGWYTALSGPDLVGAVFNVERTVDGLVTARYQIRITAASTAQEYWQPPAGLLNTYELQWRMVYPSSTHLVPVCNNPPNRLDGEGTWWRKTTEAVLFTGDRYNSDSLTVTAGDPASSGDWFNIGCSGTVLAKLALNRHTYATQSSTAPTTIAQRQAMLKMYTSDVCNTGDALTVVGTPLRWNSTTGLASPPIAVNSYEARWTAAGAICLDTHRTNGTANDMDVQIAEACAVAGKAVPPPCAGAPTSYYLRTTSPALP
ncbi:MAG: hypothetical protein IPH44_29600 [Myxococcales bacterium]|nr:hypothetical protein [Myxococcales bacterium]MBK7192143.1 hypothetical protein [Myxococcales bacterium]MBP7292457.1 hypothetical protein [Nannocystaceae bacterium]